MNRPNVMLLDAVVTIDGTDVGTVSMLDGPVTLEMAAQQVSASGQRGVDIFTDTVKRDHTLTLTGVFWDMQILEKLEGWTSAPGTLEDGATPSQNSTLNSECESVNRPYVELLITGNKHNTQNPANGNAPYRVEIKATRAQLFGNIEYAWSKAEHTKAKLTFKLHAEADKSANWIEVHDEEMES